MQQMRHAGSPMRTNASLNRSAAARAFAAGVTIREIAGYWPEVWRVTVENGRETLAQKYDYALADGSGRWETTRRITETSVRACIRQHGRG